MGENCNISQRRIFKAAVAVLIVSALLLIISFATARNNRTIFGTGLGGDWLAFYDAAHILNSHQPARLYDLNFQAELYHQNLPGEPPEASLPYANAPFLALIFRPLAEMAYAWSFAIWTIFSIAMFIIAIALAWRAADLPREKFRFGLLICLSFEPLAMECIHGGQISAIAMLVISLAIFFHIYARPILAGVMLSICIYKPTLLPIVILMLLATRQWRVLRGFFLGAICIIAFSAAICGVGPWIDYGKLLVQYAGFSAAPADESIFRTWKFVDLNAFLKLLHVAPIGIALILLAAAMAVFRAAMKLRNVEMNADQLRLAWACALTATLVLNIYVGIYDSVLVLPAMLLTAGIFLRQNQPIPTAFLYTAIAIFMLPWCSQSLASHLGFQPYSLGLIALLCLQYRLLMLGVRSDNTKVFNLNTTMSSV